jgi:hypothetical protein
MPRSALVCITCGLLLASRLGAEEKYTLKLKSPGKGDIVSITSEATEDGDSTFTLDGKPMTEKGVKVTTLKYREEMLEKEEGKRPSRSKLTYDKAEVKKDDKATTLGVEGKTVLMQRKDGKNQYTFDDGKEVSKEDAAHLSHGKSERDDRTFEQMLLPPGPVAVGESWKIDMKAVAKELTKDDDSLTIDGDKAKGTGKLNKVSKKDGKLFGEITFELELPVLKMKFDNDEIAMDAGSKMVITDTIDGCLDGSMSNRKVTRTADITIAGSGKVGKSNVALDSKGKFTQKETEEEVKK